MSSAFGNVGIGNIDDRYTLITVNNRRCEMWSLRTRFGGDVFDELERMRREMDQMFGDWSGGPTAIRSVGARSYPQINVGASPEQVDVYAFAAGLDPKSLDISMQQNLLTITGERKLDERENVDYYRKERFTGSFRRVISLPEDVDPDKVNASYRDGILHLIVQRREAVKPRKVEVK
jgi:HSP20 family protein